MPDTAKEHASVRTCRRRVAAADSGGVGAVAGFALFVEVAAVDIVDHGDREVLHLQAADGLGAEFFIVDDLGLLDGTGDDGARCSSLVEKGRFGLV